VAVENAGCETNADCDEGECCLQIQYFRVSVCKKLREKDDWCMPEIDLNIQKHKFMCPCAKGLSCVPEVKEEKNGVTIYKNSKCLEDSTDTSDEPSL
ncbi:hypothetical protein CDAR_579881, partial [Caerostris darwini]